MGQVESRAIELHYGRSPGRVRHHAPRSSHPAEPARDAAVAGSITAGRIRASQVGEVRTTGLFSTPTGDGNLIGLDVFLSSFSDSEETASVEVNRVVDGNLETLFFRSIGVPARGARRIEVGEVDGETIEVSVRSSSDRLVPSAAVTEMFLADGAIVTLIFKSPEDFVRI